MNLRVLGVGKVVRELAGVLSAWSAAAPLIEVYNRVKDEDQGGETEKSD